MFHTLRGAFHVRRNVMGLVCGSILVGLTACQALPGSAPADAAPPVPVFTFVAKDHTFEGPSQIPAGLVSLSFENVGHHQHFMQLVALNEGVTIAQLTAAYGEGQQAVAALVKGADGGPAPIAPGGKQQVTLQLPPGQYAVLCLIPDDQGVTHLAKGMVAPLTVTGDMPPNQPEPVADGTVTLRDFSFVLPDAIKPGPQTWKIVNEGQQPHEIGLIKLAAGKTLEDVIASYQAGHGERPYEPAGGFQSIDSGERGWLHLTLEPGVYVAYCDVPDPASGTPHHQLGMVQSFMVP